MLGILVNVTAIIIGSSFGAILKKGIKGKYKDIATQSIGLVTIALGTTWIVSNMTDNKVPLLFIISLVIGGIIGELIGLDRRVNNLSDKFKTTNGNNLIDGLTTAILLFCIGTLSILGPIESALKGDNTLLFTNAILDGITSIILASTYGIGIILSAVVLFIWQGSIFISAQYISFFITDEILGQISIIGGILILSTGINILKIAKIKTLNLLPALFIPIIYYIPVINNFFNNIIDFLN